MLAATLLSVSWSAPHVLSEASCRSCTTTRYGAPSQGCRARCGPAVCGGCIDGRWQRVALATGNIIPLPPKPKLVEEEPKPYADALCTRGADVLEVTYPGPLAEYSLRRAKQAARRAAAMDGSATD